MERFLALSVLLWLAAGSADAAVVITVGDVELTESSSTQTASFEVFLNIDDATPRSIDEFDVTVNITPAGSGVAATGDGGQTVNHPYVFPGSGGPAINASNGGATVTAKDVAFSPMPIVDNSGLARINFTVAPNTLGTFTVTVDAANSVLKNSFTGTNYGFGTQSGTITITSAIPEPGSLALMGLVVSAVGTGAGVRRWRTRRNSQPLG